MKLYILLIFFLAHHFAFSQVRTLSRQSLVTNKIKEIKIYDSEKFGLESLNGHYFLNDSGCPYKTISCHYFVDKLDTTDITTYTYDSLSREISRHTVAKDKSFFTERIYLNNNTVKIIDRYDGKTTETIKKEFRKKNITIWKIYENGKNTLTITLKKDGDTEKFVWHNKKRHSTTRTTDYLDSNNNVLKTINKTNRPGPRGVKRSSYDYTYDSQNLRVKECSISINGKQLCSYFQYIK